MLSHEERIAEVKRRIETAATMFGGSATLGYIVIGLLAFVLGVCVTILCFRIRLLNKEGQTEEQKGDNADGTCQ